MQKITQVLYRKKENGYAKVTFEIDKDRNILSEIESPDDRGIVHGEQITDRETVVTETENGIVISKVGPLDLKVIKVFMPGSFQCRDIVDNDDWCRFCEGVREEYHKLVEANGGSECPNCTKGAIKRKFIPSIKAEILKHNV